MGQKSLSYSGASAWNYLTESMKKNELKYTETEFEKALFEGIKHLSFYSLHQSIIYFGVVRDIFLLKIPAKKINEIYMFYSLFIVKKL